MSKTARILIIRVGRIGDTIWASLFIAAVRDIYGENCAIDLVVSPLAKKLFANDPRINNIFTIKKTNMPIQLSADKKKVINHAKSNPYDLIINVESHQKYEKLARRISSKHCISNNKTIQNDKNDHVVICYNRILKQLPQYTTDKIYSPSLQPHSHLEKPLQFKSPCIVLSPATSSSIQNFTDTRTWPLKHWQALTDQLSPNYNLVILGSKQDIPFINELKLPSSAHNLVGKTTLDQSLTIIQRAALLIAADTGTIHMAAALATPVIGLYGPSNPQATGPFVSNPNMAAIFSCYLDNGYGLYEPNMPKELAMQSITPSMVIKQVNHMLAN